MANVIIVLGILFLIGRVLGAHPFAGTYAEKYYHKHPPKMPRFGGGHPGGRPGPGGDDPDGGFATRRIVKNVIIVVLIIILLSNLNFVLQVLDNTLRSLLAG